MTAHDDMTAALDELRANGWQVPPPADQEATDSAKQKQLPLSWEQLEMFDD